MESNNIDDLALRVETKKAIKKLAETANDPNLVFETSHPFLPTDSTTITASFESPTFTPETNKPFKFKKFDWTDKKARRALVKMLSDNCSVIGPL